ncbi:MAG: hypothetical protein WBN53_00785, partial [Thermodesulfobacteriota bacterium]
LRAWKSLPLKAKGVPYSPAPAGVYTKMATPIIPRTKKALFGVADKFFIMNNNTKIIRYKETIVKNVRQYMPRKAKRYPSDLSLSAIHPTGTNMPH